ncbi:hypothetical protein MKW94_007604, partial [Papaver nudicaule]|nr:hypothetical protein [Papaver nudicaule]
IESAKLSEGVLPEKIRIKKQFSIGVNEVTRILERMKPMSESGSTSPQPALDSCVKKGGSSVRLQAVIVAADCNPRWLTKHIPSLAYSRKVPLIFVRDKKGGSLRLGEIVKMKTAIVIGVKVTDSGINKLIGEILNDNGNVVTVGIPEAE